MTNGRCPSAGDGSDGGVSVKCTWECVSYVTICRMSFYNNYMEVWVNMLKIECKC